MTLVALIGTAVVAVGSLVASLLHKKGKDQAADVVENIVEVIRKLLGVISTTSDAAVRSSALVEIRKALAQLDGIGSPAAKAAAAKIRKEMA